MSPLEPMEINADRARLIQNVLAELGWHRDATVIAEHVRRLDIGLPCEDEFSVLCSWLGRCQLLHKLDQQQVPIRSLEEFQVPDLLAMFTTQSTKLPVLIEVKSKRENTLSFKPEYLRRLENYAALLNLPLLIAWKFHSIWILFEVKHLQKAKRNFNISLNRAMQENLLGVLAGDVACKIGAGAGIHLKFRKDKLLNQAEAADGLTQEWKMTIEESFFTDYHGTRRTDLDAEVTSLLTTWDLEKTEEHSDSHIQVSFIAGTEGIQFSHTALVRLLEWGSPQDQRLHWRSLLRKEQVTANIANYSAALKAALRQSVVYYVFDYQPMTMPDFLVSRSMVASSGKMGIGRGKGGAKANPE